MSTLQAELLQVAEQHLCNIPESFAPVQRCQGILAEIKLLRHMRNKPSANCLHGRSHPSLLKLGTTLKSFLGTLVTCILNRRLGAKQVWKCKARARLAILLPLSTRILLSGRRQCQALRCALTCSCHSLLSSGHEVEVLAIGLGGVLDLGLLSGLSDIPLTIAIYRSPGPPFVSPGAPNLQPECAK